MTSYCGAHRGVDAIERNRKQAYIVVSFFSLLRTRKIAERLFCVRTQPIIFSGSA